MATDFKSGLEITKFKALFKDDRKDLVNMARIAEQAERYEDMCKFMRALVEWTDSKAEKQDLTVEERNLLSVAYKNVIGARRAAWRTLNVDDHKDDSLIQVYKKQIEGELDGICQDVLKLLNAILLKNCTEQGEARVFYLKMAGDYYRYLAEFVTDQNYGQKAVNMYQEAMKIAQTKLAPPHPIRLGLALNFSVCYYEILHDKVRACELAKTAFDAAMQKLDQVREEMYKDCTLIMQLLRDNLTLWTSGDHDQLQMQDVDGNPDAQDAAAAQPAAGAPAPAAGAPAS